MKIHIEPMHRAPAPIATDNLYSGGGRIRQIQERQLALETVTQARKNWCWAAVSSAIARYFGDQSPDQGMDQERVAWQLLGTADSPRPEALDNAQFDQPAQLEEALAMIGCLAAWSGSRPPFRRLIREIDAGRPLAMGLTWASGGHHYLLIDGYRLRDRTLSVMDPQTGRSVVRFDDFPARYREGGEWTETYWTTSSR